MKKVFNASLVAASLAMAFAANAAVISQTTANKKVLSQEGLAVGLTHTGSVTFDVTVSKNHPATSEIVLTVGPTVDLGSLDGVYTCAGVTSDGVISCDLGGNADAIVFNVGSGNFTFDNLVVDGDDGTVTFEVNIGNAMSADSAFRVTLGDAVDMPVISGAATVSYASTWNGSPVETGSGSIASVAKQFSIVAGDTFGKFIKRSDGQIAFTDGTDVDTASFVVTNAIDTITADDTEADFEGMKAVLTGSFGAANGAVTYITQLTIADFDDAAGTLSSANSKLNFEYEADGGAGTAPADADSEGTEYVLTFDNAAVNPLKIAPQAMNLAVTLEYSDGGAETGTVSYSESAGEWKLDVAQVNVPYLPIGYAQFSPIVEIANRSSANADITIEAFGKSLNGAAAKKYEAVTLAKKAAKNGVTTITETDIMNAFGLAKGDNEKLTITFTVDAPLADVTLAPYYRENESRVNIVTDQYKK